MIFLIEVGNANLDLGNFEQKKTFVFVVYIEIIKVMIAVLVNSSS